jgi:hypothetical protein
MSLVKERLWVRCVSERIEVDIVVVWLKGNDYEISMVKRSVLRYWI